MSLKHAILGFLSLSPMSGYDLKKAFDRSVQHFWPANQSQIYRTLAELDEQGLVSKEVISREDRLDMKVYSLTAAGQSELHNWLAAPLRPQDTREPFLIQLFFGGQLSEAELLNLLQHQLRGVEETLAVYTTFYEATTTHLSQITPTRAQFLQALTLEFGLKAQQVHQRWLQNTLERIQTGNYTLADLNSPIG